MRRLKELDMGLVSVCGAAWAPLAGQLGLRWLGSLRYVDGAARAVPYGSRRSFGREFVNGGRMR